MANNAIGGLMDAEAILNTPLTEPERVFSADKVKSDFIHLIKKWHPDRCKDAKATEVVKHLAALRRAAEKKLVAGLWQTPGLLSITTITGKKYEFKYHTKHEFALGNVYLSKHLVLYVINKQHKALYENAVQILKSLKFASTAMQSEMQRFLPKVELHTEGAEHYYLLIHKTPDAVLLRDLYNHYQGKIPAEHVGWIISAVLNIGCYLSWAQLTHNDISLDTVFVSPKNHAGLLLGGWWYALPNGESLRGKTLPTRSVNLMSSKQLRDKKAQVELDQDLIRALARELLGDVIGSRLTPSKECPKALITWAKGTTTKNAIDNYQQWKAALANSFGKPKFVKMNITPNQIYSS